MTINRIHLCLNDRNGNPTYDTVVRVSDLAPLGAAVLEFIRMSSIAIEPTDDLGNGILDKYNASVDRLIALLKEIEP